MIIDGIGHKEGNSNTHGKQSDIKNKKRTMVACGQRNQTDVSITKQTVNILHKTYFECAAPFGP